MARILTSEVVLVLISATMMVAVSAQTSRPDDHCVHKCLSRFTSTADKIMGGQSTGGGVSWQNLLHMSGNGIKPRTAQEMRRSFDDMCASYRTMLSCVSRCRQIWLRDSVVSGFASIQYVCEDRYEEFITHLPCLAANERKVVERCSKETNQTAAAIAALEQTVARGDLSTMTHTFAALCRNTSQIVDCLTPATRELCGNRPATLLRRLVTLGFRSIESMYQRMKIQDKLPEDCSALARSFDDKGMDGSDEDRGGKSRMDDTTVIIQRQHSHVTVRPTTTRRSRGGSDGGGGKTITPGQYTGGGHRGGGLTVSGSIAMGPLLLLLVIVSGVIRRSDFYTACLFIRI